LDFEDYGIFKKSHTLKVKRLHPDAKLPTVANPGEDLGYDLYALETIVLVPGVQTKVKTGVAAYQEGHGLLIRDRSSMAAKGITVSGGVVDAGYRGELVVIMTNHGVDTIVIDPNLCNGCGHHIDDHPYRHPFTPTRVIGYLVQAGDKIAQMLPLPVLTGAVIEVDELPVSTRGEKGFGSSGR
jgi:dUTP pyrophosphatase